MKKDKSTEFQFAVNKIQSEILEYFAFKNNESFRLDKNQIEEFTRSFIEIYPKRPVKENVGGCGLVPCYWLFFLARWLKPNFIVESGVWKGQTLWLWRYSCPDAEIHAFDIHFDKLKYRDKTIFFHEFDWANSDIKNPSPDKALAFFDDHVNQAKRIREAYERGFKWLIFDDNVPPDLIHRVGIPPIPSIFMLFDPEIKDGSVITWEVKRKKRSYTYHEENTYNARELIDYYYVFPTYTCLTLVKLK